MYNPNYLKAILIYVRDKQTGYIHIVGTDQHDRLYLDDNGNIQYMNLQNCGTTECDYEFVLDEQGHNQNNLTYTKEEQEKYGLSNMDDYFDSIDLETYMDLESKKRIQELTEINMRLVQKSKGEIKMWIRSQDLYTLIKCERLSIRKCIDKKYCVIGDECIVLGEYSTEEKAFRVLDEIQNREINYPPNEVFKMPLDYEVGGI